jgi:hypothetical protein
MNEETLNVKGKKRKARSNPNKGTKQNIQRDTAQQIGKRWEIKTAPRGIVCIERRGELLADPQSHRTSLTLGKFYHE